MRDDLDSNRRFPAADSTERRSISAAAVVRKVRYPDDVG
jgi:hypothetical protein